MSLRTRGPVGRHDEGGLPAGEFESGLERVIEEERRRLVQGASENEAIAVRISSGSRGKCTIGSLWLSATVASECACAR